MPQRDMRSRSYPSDRRRERQHRTNMPMVPLTMLAVVLTGVFFLGVYKWHHSVSSTHITHTSNSPVAKQNAQTATQQTPVQDPSICIHNTVSQAVYVSISKRHMWACNSTTQAYDSAVVTGMENIPADLTPIGTYHIYAKQADLYLDGSDSTGSWHDHVYYWMPFLSNQYGVYGFHDATWRQPNDFGNISPYASNASHGCVELPLSTAKWVYNWASVGTTVLIQS